MYKQIKLLSLQLGGSSYSIEVVLYARQQNEDVGEQEPSGDLPPHFIIMENQKLNKKEEKMEETETPEVVVAPEETAEEPVVSDEAPAEPAADKE